MCDSKLTQKLFIHESEIFITTKGVVRPSFPVRRDVQSNICVKYDMWGLSGSIGPFNNHQDWLSMRTLTKVYIFRNKIGILGSFSSEPMLYLKLKWNPDLVNFRTIGTRMNISDLVRTSKSRSIRPLLHCKFLNL